MEDFFSAEDETVRSALCFQREKLQDPNRRYALRVRFDYGQDYIRSGIRRAEGIQEAFYV